MPRLRDLDLREDGAPYVRPTVTLETLARRTCQVERWA